MSTITSFSKVGIPIFDNAHNIDPKTITDTFYIGAHISWEQCRCAGEDYALRFYPKSGVIFDIGPVHIFVMSDYDVMHFVNAFRLDSVVLQGIKLTDVSPNSVKYNLDPQTAKHCFNNYSDYDLTSDTTIISKYADPKYCHHHYFLEKGQLYDFFKHRDMYGKPIGLDVFMKSGRPSNLNTASYKTGMEKYFESKSN